MINYRDILESAANKESARVMKKVYAKFPPDSKDKRGGTLNVMLTGTTAEILKQTDYTTIKLDDLSVSDLIKLADLFKIKHTLTPE